MEHPSWVLYIALLGLILLSAFFSASETAINSLNKIRLKKQADSGDVRASAALALAERYDQTLSSILVGNNIVNISASTIATVVATALWGASGPLIATASMTVLILTFGEILPKSYSRANSDTVALRFSRVLRGFVWLLTPFNAFFSWINRRFNNMILRMSGEPDAIPSVTEEELMYILESIEEEGVIDEQERDLVQSALEFDETSIREIITPRVNMVAVDVDDSIDEIRETIIAEGYSRIPVYEGSTDNIIGILLAKDFLIALLEGREIDLRAMLSEPYFVLRTMKLSHLLANLKARKVNIAVVIDEYGGTLGIVTMEDVLEELVGEIWDEDDEIPSEFVEVADGRYEVLGSYNLQDLFETLDCGGRDTDTEFATVGGWALQLLGHIPTAGESFIQDGLLVTVTEMDGQRIAKLDILRLPSDSDKAGGPEES